MKMLVDEARQDDLVGEGLIDPVGAPAERRLDFVERARRDDPVALDRDGGRGRIVALHGDDLLGDEDRDRRHRKAGGERFVERAVGERRPHRLGDKRARRRRRRGAQHLAARLEAQRADGVREFRIADNAHGSVPPRLGSS